MSAEVRSELSTLLVEQIDSFAAMVAQRDLFRDRAVCVEQEFTAARKNITEAMQILEHDGCNCGPSGECANCRAQDVLGRAL